MTQSGPWRLKEMTPRALHERLAFRSTLLIPVGATEQHGPHLPFGCDTIIVERLADDLSRRYGVVRAPAVEFGVHSGAAPLPGGAVLRRRTLHRVMNELIESWEEEAGVREFVLLTAEADDAHLEALSTIRTDEATVQVMDIFGIEFGELLEYPGPPRQGGELTTSLLLHLAPEQVRLDLVSGSAVNFASAQKGAVLYRFILDRISVCLERERV